jgi:uncharacterized phosphosugar-binding protein
MNAIDAYTDEVTAALHRVYGSQRERLETAAAWLSETLEQGGLLYVAGSGHSHMLAEEVFYRAGGLAAVYPLLEPSLMLHAGALKSSRFERLEGVAASLLRDTDIGSSDLLVIASNSGRNAFPIEVALEAKERGCRTIAITSCAHSQQVTSRHSSGKRLFEVTDLVIDNGVPYGDASLPIEGLARKIGPLSSLTGIYILNAVVARAVELQVVKGRFPDIFVSANIEGDETPFDWPTWRRRVKGL